MHENKQITMLEQLRAQIREMQEDNFAQARRLNKALIFVEMNIDEMKWEQEKMLLSVSARLEPVEVIHTNGDNAA